MAEDARVEVLIEKLNKYVTNKDDLPHIARFLIDSKVLEKIKYDRAIHQYPHPRWLSHEGGINGDGEIIIGVLKQSLARNAAVDKLTGGN